MELAMAREKRKAALCWRGQIGKRLPYLQGAIKQRTRV